MRVLALLALLAALAACSKHEPPPVITAAPVKPATVSPAPVVAKSVPPAAAIAPASPSSDGKALNAVLSPALLPGASPGDSTRGLHSPAAAGLAGRLPNFIGETPQQVAGNDSAFKSIRQDGSAVYDRICATCHMADGNGVPFMQPAIKGSAWISNPDPQLLLSLILRGAAVLGDAANAYDNKMAPQDALSDAEIAAVATYVRERFAATPITKPVTPAEVAIARARPGLPQ